MSILGVFVLVQLIAVFGGVVGLGSEVSVPCASFGEIPAIWLNSSTQATKIVGNEFTAYAKRPDGEAHLPTMHGMAWYDIQELEMIPSIADPTSLKCAAGFALPEQAQPVLLRQLDPENTCLCTQRSGTRPFPHDPSIQEDFVDVEITRPDWPGFLLTATFSLVNQTWNTTIPASPETFDLEYQLTWTPQAPKISFQITNWNWTYPGVANSSLRLYFWQLVSSDEDTWLNVHETKPFTVFSTNTTNAFIQTTYVDAFRADGIDYAIERDPVDDRSYFLQKDQPQRVPIAFNLCHGFVPPNFTYSDLYYDPSIVALFTGDFQDGTIDNQPDGGNNKNKSLHPAAYAVPIAFVALIILLMIGLVIFVPSFRKWIMPFSKTKNNAREVHSKEHNTTIPMDSKQEKNGWVRSTPAP